MGLIFVPLLLATLLSQQTDAAYLQKPAATSSAPAFAWGSVPVLRTGASDEASRVIYEDTDSTTLATGLWESLSQAVSTVAAESPQALLLYIGNKLRLEDVSAKQASSALLPLQDSMKSAESSISIPSLVHEEAQSLGDSLLASFQAKAPSAQTAGACSTASLDIQETPAQAMQRLKHVQASGPKVLVVCGHPDADLASELTHVSQYSQALREAFGSHVMAYVSEMSAEETNDAGASRSLLQSMELPNEMSGLQLPSYASLTQASDTYLCDAKCFTQVRVIEVFILFVTLLTALLSGICMMNVLGTPSKFETTKEARQES
ncbi:hypothetical protein WJX77_004725 [Trebouxia sp. C0004]